MTRPGGTDVAFRLVGEGPVTVLVTQGLANASAEWWPIADALAERARVLTWGPPWILRHRRYAHP